GDGVQVRGGHGGHGANGITWRNGGTEIERRCAGSTGVAKRRCANRSDRGNEHPCSFGVRFPRSGLSALVGRLRRPTRRIRHVSAPFVLVSPFLRVIPFPPSST